MARALAVPHATSAQEVIESRGSSEQGLTRQEAGTLTLIASELHKALGRRA